MSGYAPDTLEPAEMWRDNAACASPGVDPEEMFPGNDPVLVGFAKRICGGCPVLGECRNWALDQRVEFGVWGGLSEGERRTVLRLRAKRRQDLTGQPAPAAVGQRPAAPCGTTAAYERHRRNHEVIDAECRAAYSEARQERRAAQIAAANCNTRNGYLRHLSRNEKPCDDCRRANTDANRSRNLHPECGTTKAYYQHILAGEPIDDACQDASDAYEQRLQAAQEPAASA